MSETEKMVLFVTAVRWTGGAVATLIVGYLITAYVSAHLKDAKRDGVSRVEGLKTARDGCLDGCLKTGMIVIVLVVVASAIGNLPSCSRYRPEPENYRR